MTTPAEVIASAIRELKDDAAAAILAALHLEGFRVVDLSGTGDQRTMGCTCAKCQFERIGCK